MKSQLVTLAAGLLLPIWAGAQARPPAPPQTPAEKIANAMSAAPAAISAAATIMDWPSGEGAQPQVLRQGSNGWVCYPDFPGSEGNDPQCLDEVWQKFIAAYIARSRPEVTRVGIGYMLAPGGAAFSNTDPFATGPTADNEWGHHGPHLMLLVPNAAALQGLPTRHSAGGPWVMWRDTPYVHIMVPVSGSH